MSVGNPQNEWEQGMLDAFHAVFLDPIIEQTFRKFELEKHLSDLAHVYQHRGQDGKS